jgi:hypothetical protein
MLQANLTGKLQPPPSRGALAEHARPGAACRRYLYRLPVFGDNSRMNCTRGHRRRPALGNLGHSMTHRRLGCLGASSCGYGAAGGYSRQSDPVTVRLAMPLSGDQRAKRSELNGCAADIVLSLLSGTVGLTATAAFVLDGGRDPAGDRGLRPRRANIGLPPRLKETHRRLPGCIRNPYSFSIAGGTGTENHNKDQNHKE